MNAIVVHKKALSFIDMQKLSNINTSASPSTIDIIVMDNYGETKKFCVRDFEAKDILEEIPSEYKMKLY